MSPRPAASAHDETAEYFLSAGARLIDALFTPVSRSELPPRLRSLHFPAPLDWIRVEDVIREARSAGGKVSSKAFWNRWPDKDAFIVDLAHYTVTHAQAGESPIPASEALRSLLEHMDAPISQIIGGIGTSVVTELLAHPRSFLIGHLAAVVHHAPELHDRLQEDKAADEEQWIQFYEATAAAAGLRYRPGWDGARVQLVVKILLDGVLIGSRTLTEPDGGPLNAIRILVDAVTALFAGVLDLDDSGRSVPELLDETVARRASAS